MGFSSTDHYVKGFLYSMDTQILSALGRARDLVRGDSLNTVLMRWFGDTSAAWKSELSGKLNKLRNTLNTETITIGFEDLRSRNAGTNASAYTAGIASVPLYARAIDLNLAFKGLPDYLPLNGGGTIRNDGWIQSKFETLVHELSHLVLDTDDEMWNGHEAYGTKRASRLAANNPRVAKNNAENWGIFVEAVSRKIS